MVLRRALTLLATALAVPLLGGCAGEPDGAELHEVYVLLDRESRAEYTLVTSDYRGKPTLPMAIDADEPVILRGDEKGAPESERYEPGTLLYMSAGAGREILQVGKDVRADRLVVRGSEEAAEELALLLGGSSTPRGDDLWNVTAPDIYTRTSFMEAPQGVLDVLPDSSFDVGDIEPPEPVNPAIVGSAGARYAADLASAEPGRREALVVGIYATADAALTLDASGRYSLRDRCASPEEMPKEGRYHVADGVVILQPEKGPAMSLAIEKDSLILPSGDGLRSVEPGWALAMEGGPK
jgi:hypothetical protein